MDATLPDDLIFLPEAATLLHLHLATLRRWIFAGRLRAWRVGRRYTVSKAELLAVPMRVEVTPCGATVPETRRETSARHRRAMAELARWGIG